MSKVIEELKNSNEPLENDLALVYEHWQENKRNQGLPASLGYEPRDIRVKGAVAVISARVLKASSGFEEVDPNQSYEALVLKYPSKFDAKIIEAAKERLHLGASLAHAFQSQDIQFFIKTSLYDLFGRIGISISKDEWIGQSVNIPSLRKENEFAEVFLTNGFRSFIWLHEQEKHGEKGRGLSAVVQFGAMNNERVAQIIDVVVFERPVGKDLFASSNGDDEFLARVDSYRHTRIWPINNSEVSIFLAALRAKVHQIADYESSDPDPSDEQNLEMIEEVTGLRKMVLRRNQSAFRKTLLAQRPNCCAISATNEITVLEAAHIIPYSERFADRDSPENGLLLRSDIHKLFDAHLISINPETKVVEVAESVQSPDYVELKGKTIKDTVSVKSLTHHFREYCAKKSK